MTSFWMPFVVCLAVHQFVGMLYVLFARDRFINWVEKRVDLPGAVQLPDRLDSFHDKFALSWLLAFVWPGEIVRVVAVYRNRKRGNP